MKVISNHIRNVHEQQEERRSGKRVPVIWLRLRGKAESPNTNHEAHVG